MASRYLAAAANSVYFGVAEELEAAGEHVDYQSLVQEWLIVLEDVIRDAVSDTMHDRGQS